MAKTDQVLRGRYIHGGMLFYLKKSVASVPNLGFSLCSFFNIDPQGVYCPCNGSHSTTKYGEKY